MVKTAALGTFVSCSLVIFFSPSKSKNDSKVGGAFMVKIYLQHNNLQIKTHVVKFGAQHSSPGASSPITQL